MFVDQCLCWFKLIDGFVRRRRKQGYYGETDDFLYSALDVGGGLKVPNLKP